MKKFLSLLLGVCICGIIVYESSAVKQVTPAPLSNKLVRFHVIANSDSSEDQRVKLKVRDAILNKMGPEMEKIDNQQVALAFLRDNAEKINTIAIDTLKQEKKNYSAKTSVGMYTFPVKTYSTITLPAGSYNALRVVLGDGGGKNWWCVMFPPLCFIDVARGLTSEVTDKELKRVVTDDEMNDIYTFGDSDKTESKVDTKEDSKKEENKSEGKTEQKSDNKAKDSSSSKSENRVAASKSEESDKSEAADEKVNEQPKAYANSQTSQSVESTHNDLVPEGTKIEFRFRFVELFQNLVHNIQISFNK